MRKVFLFDILPAQFATTRQVPIQQRYTDFTATEQFNEKMICVAYTG